MISLNVYSWIAQRIKIESELFEKKIFRIHVNCKFLSLNWNGFSFFYKRRLAWNPLFTVQYWWLWVVGFICMHIYSVLFLQGFHKNLNIFVQRVMMIFYKVIQFYLYTKFGRYLWIDIHIICTIILFCGYPQDLSQIQTVLHQLYYIDISAAVWKASWYPPSS